MMSFLHCSPSSHNHPAGTKIRRPWSRIIEGGCLGPGYARDGRAAREGHAGGAGGLVGELAHDLGLLFYRLSTAAAIGECAEQCDA